MAAIFSAAIHDVDHPGLTNQYLINTSEWNDLIFKDTCKLNVPCLISRFWACPDVQRWVRSGKSPSGCGVQVGSEPRLWYFCQPEQETEADSEEDGHWHGENNHK